MSGDSAPSAYARDYLNYATMNALAYRARAYAGALGKSGAELAEIIRGDDGSLAAFEKSGIDIDAFARNYEIVDSKFPDIEGANGADMLVFRNVNTDTLTFAIAGVNNASKNPLDIWGGGNELYTTASSTYVRGYNEFNYNQVEEVYDRVMERYPTAKIDIIGHSLGGQTAQILTAHVYMRGELGQLLTVTTFGSYGVRFFAALEPSVPQKNRDLLNALDQINGSISIVNFATDGDVVASKLNNLGTNQIVGPFYITIDDGIFGYIPGGLLSPHSIFTYIDALRMEENNRTPIIYDLRTRDDIAQVLQPIYGENAKAIAGQAKVVVTASTGQTELSYSSAQQRGHLTSYRDPKTGALVPEGFDVTIIHGKPFYTDREGQKTIFIVEKDDEGNYYNSAAISGNEEMYVVRQFLPDGSLVATDFNGSAFVGLDSADAAGIFGSQLGYRLAKDFRGQYTD